MAGLLSDVSKQRQLMRKVAQKHTLIGCLAFIIGLVWSLMLVNDDMNSATYVSENALLPGQVRVQFGRDPTQLKVSKISQAIGEACQASKGKMPVDFLIGRLRDFGMDAYSQSFEVTYGVGTGSYPPVVMGTNVYGVLRSRRGDGKEGLVINIPYSARGAMPAHGKEALTGLALALSLMEYFAEQTYWARDIVLLISDAGYVGAEAWLEAYHSVNFGQGLKREELGGRAGALQAALVLDFAGEKFTSVELMYEGINGQLSNLDLINAVARICRRERVETTVHHIGKGQKRMAKPAATFLKDTLPEEMAPALRTVDRFWNMIRFQASGVPSGLHGLYYRYQIPAAITMRGILEDKKGAYVFDIYAVGRAVESSMRSLNNLLERFHQSFFFYMLPSPWRYISIGVYMPPFLIMCAGLLLSAMSLWLQSGDWLYYRALEVSKDDKCFIPASGVPFSRRPRPISNALLVFLGALIGSCLVAWLPLFMSRGQGIGQTDLNNIYAGIGAGFAAMLVLMGAANANISGDGSEPTAGSKPEDSTSPTRQRAGPSDNPEAEDDRITEAVLRLNEMREAPTWVLLKCFTLLYAAGALVCVALLNYSLALLLATYIVPLCLLTKPGGFMSIRTLVQATALAVTSPPAIFVAVCSLLKVPHEDMVAYVLQNYQLLSVWTIPCACVIAMPVNALLLHLTLIVP